MPTPHAQQNPSRQNFAHRYLPSTTETMLVQYAQRGPDREPVEGPNDIIWRVATAVALAELRYILKPSEILKLTLDEAVSHPIVQQWATTFADCIGNQKFWANTPANINADPEVSLMVLKYEAYGHKAGLSFDEIWSGSAGIPPETGNKRAWNSMQQLARELRGRGCLAACGVTYVEDSLIGIQRAATEEAIAAKASMGMGLNTSTLRPWGTITRNGAAASGPDRFYEKAISQAVDAVAQGGRRGGALIEIRNSDHPDILFFIDKKRIPPKPRQDQYESPDDFGAAYHKWLTQQNYLKNTNISVLAMPGFMEAVKSKNWYQCSFESKPWSKPIYDVRRPKLDDNGVQLVDKMTKEKVYESYTPDISRYPESMLSAPIETDGWLYAPDVFDRILEGMADSGEPGLMFYDLVNQGNANNAYYDLVTSNPCAEQCLPAGPSKIGGLYFMGVCNLSSLHAAHESFWNEDGSYNYKAMQQVVRIQQRFMDNVTDVSWFPHPEQNWTARAERRNGGGFAGVAEYLSRLGVRFGSVEGCSATKNLFAAMAEAAYLETRALAAERGPYPLWNASRYKSKLDVEVRNTCTLNNAPTGTLAQMMQTTWGIEPHLGIVFSRKVRTAKVNFLAPGFIAAMQKHGAWPSTEEQQDMLMETIRANDKSVRGLASVPTPVQKLFPIRSEITPDGYMSHLIACYQGARSVADGMQMNAISNTCQIPSEMTDSELRAAVILAWTYGVKAITFYPDGSRLSQPVEVLKQAPQGSLPEAPQSLPEPSSPTPMPDYKRVDISVTSGETYKIKVGGDAGQKTLHISLNTPREAPGALVEIYARLGKNGDAGPFEAIGRISSAFLQFAAALGESERQQAEDIIVKQLIGISSGHIAWHKFPDEEKALVVQSACDGIAKAIQYFRRRFPSRSTAGTDNEQVAQVAAASALSGARSATCPRCSRGMTRYDGCWNCVDCGYSKCG